MLDIDIPLLDVWCATVARIDHAGTVLVTPGDIVRWRHIAILRKSTVPVKDPSPGIHGVGAQLPSAACLHIGRLAQRCARETVERIGFIEDAVGTPGSPLVKETVCESDARAEIAVANAAEITAARAA